MLAPYTVLDCTNERGMLAGQILADLGADVIQVEPPGGSSARHEPPFANDDEGPNTSLFWWAYARNKRGITCDLDTADGQGLFRRLAANADFVLESDDVGVMAARGLAYDDLAAGNPRLVYTSITPWGQDGPKAGWKASDLILMAAGGPLILMGFPDRSPVRTSLPQAYHHAAADAAAATMIAHTERRRSGRGQHVDVAAVQSVTAATQALVLSAPLGDTESMRAAGGFALGPLKGPLIWDAADGYVSLTFLFGTAIGPFTRRLMEWICESDMCTPEDRDKDWLRYAEMLLTGEEPLAEYERILDVVRAFLLTKTKAELLAEGQRRKLLIVPVSTVEDVANSPQLAAREYWRDVERPDGGGVVRHPGPFVRFSADPIDYRRRAPTLGEHNAEVYATLGLGDADLQELRAKGVI